MNKAGVLLKQSRNLLFKYDQRSSTNTVEIPAVAIILAEPGMSAMVPGALERRQVPANDRHPSRSANEDGRKHRVCDVFWKTERAVLTAKSLLGAGSRSLTLIGRSGSGDSLLQGPRAAG